MPATERAFAGVPTSPADARHFARDALAGLIGAAAPVSLCEDVELLVSELVTNAVRAGSGTAVVGLSVQGRRLTVTVTDDAAGWPEPRDAGVHDTGGRGLPLVSAISSTWGVRMAQESKVVWAELEIPA